MLRIALLSCAVVFAPAVAMAAEQRWAPLSKTADSITGPITVAPDRVTMSGRIFLTGAAVRVRNYKADTEPPPVEAQARPVRSARSANPVLLNHNRLCSRPVRWIVTWRTPDGLGMSASSAATVPTDAYGPASCGTYFYVPFAKTK